MWQGVTLHSTAYKLARAKTIFFIGLYNYYRIEKGCKLKSKQRTFVKFHDIMSKKFKKRKFTKRKEKFAEDI